MMHTHMYMYLEHDWVDDKHCTKKAMELSQQNKYTYGNVRLFIYPTTTIH